jgi:uncharacterized membrane-anchored protein
MIKKRREHAAHIRQNAHKRLRMNLRIMFVVYIVLLIVTVVTAVRSHTMAWQVLLGLLIGVVAGIISSRMYKISWSHDEAKVIGKIDVYGVLVLVLFVIFELNRNGIASTFAPQEAIGAVGLALAAGALYGRLLGTGKKILAVLHEEKILH